MTFQVRDSRGHGPQGEEGAFFLCEFFCRVSTLTKATRNGPAPASPQDAAARRRVQAAVSLQLSGPRGSGAEHRRKPGPLRSLRPPLWLSSQERTFLLARFLLTRLKSPGGKAASLWGSVSLELPLLVKPREGTVPECGAGLRSPRPVSPRPHPAHIVGTRGPVLVPQLSLFPGVHPPGTSLPLNSV